jgi:two-component system cell cycle sensor histidine kinase/response regulator CckA
MHTRHPLLRRQIAARLGPESEWPESVQRFVEAVDAAYQQSDADRMLLERSLDLSSQELLQANSDMRAVIQAFPDLFLWVSLDGTVEGCRAQDSVDLLLPPSALLGKRLEDIPDPDAAAKFREALTRVRSGTRLVTVEYALQRNGAQRYYEARLIALNERQILVIVRNITDRRIAEQALGERDEQLRQAQKMEAVGLLAGGIAHDFNNLLTAITGYAGLVLDQLEADHPLRSDVEQIRRAGDSAGSLTRQLLAFSRRQILRPQIIDLNDVVLRTDAMLRRLIGEHIELQAKPGSPLDRVNVDPGQVEQIIVNLAVNARDAMPGGGRLTIETANIHLDEAALASHETAPAGRYVCLAISDTGNGIPEDVRPHVFEPFFTTKARGEGTGLGLATVYGIVKQSGGMIWLYSEVGIGTTFKIYFPAAVQPHDATRPPARRERARGTETVLVAEDQSEVRSVTEAILTRSGYTVLAASGGDQALQLAQVHADRIDLLLTDVVMPGMSGPDLATRLHDTRPSTRVLFASGYTDDGVVRSGILDPGFAFIQKPFTPDALLARVRDVLDQAAESTPSSGT